MYTKKTFGKLSAKVEDPNNRRNSPRRHLIYYLKVWDVGKRPPQMLGHLADITLDGLMLVSEQAIPTGQNFDLEIRWQNPDAGEHSIRFRARSRWASPDVNTSFYDTGFRFEDNNPDGLSAIQELINHYGFQD